MDETEAVCPDCGLVQRAIPAAGAIECENHADEPAVCCCMACGKPVCGDCSRSRNGKYYCDDIEHERISQECEVIVATRSEFEADMIAANLRQNDLQPLVFPVEGLIATFWIPQLRLVRVMLPKHTLKKGRDALQSLGLTKDPEDDPASKG